MNRKLLLQDLVQSMVDKGCSRKDADTFVRAFFLQVEKNVFAGEAVKISGLGTFRLLRMDARKSVDVNTGRVIEIREHYKFSFLPDAVLRESVNRPLAHLAPVGVDVETGPLFSIYDPDAAEASEATVAISPEKEEKNIENEMNNNTKENNDMKETKMKKEQKTVKKENEKEKTSVKPAPKKRLLLPVLAACVLLFVVIYVFFFLSGSRRGRHSSSESPVISVVNEASAPEKLSADSGSPVKTPSSLTLKTAKGTLTLDGLEADPMTWEGGKKVKVSSGDRLTLIAQKHYGAKIYWVYLFLANRDVLENPNALAAGTVIRIPAAPSSLVDAGNPQTIEKALSVETQLKKWFD